ncbi:cytidine deaminase [Rhodoblastus acidophilus]|uniref:anti-phage dCTP deaminase n=1 Tax=Rhodoblastus acidophilus TaxID=1074 RepID=UPI002224893C|nr:anti-phage dCTP deaminase [Rhodoblastus acidophilus]MCW2319294.1 cytidine deaminase [Rhodoblastus acidophilus]
MTRRKIDFPELFFCIVAPIGTDLDDLTEALGAKLGLLGYHVEKIHITDVLKVIDNTLPNDFASEYDRYDKLIKHSNSLRKSFNDDALLAKISFFLIQDKRKKFEEAPAPKKEGIAYIIRQFKRPEEIGLFRSVYGQQVFQLSAYADPDVRKARLVKLLRDKDHHRTRSEDFELDATKLIRRDEHEALVPHGQRIRDVFPLADVFIDTDNREITKKTLSRFVELIFGNNFYSPSREEYGMYAAKTASLRSLDLSRQVGAAICDPRGHVKTLGCNEVPSPRGGTYWCNDEGDAREYVGKLDTNEEFKFRMLSDTLLHLSEVGVVDKEYTDVDGRTFLRQIKDKTSISLDKKMMIMDVIEYGRIIHAEMNAITDAAREGIRVKDSILYCTTFPCHLCAKHIISSGIKMVVYIEPYPKSYATELYKDDIVLKREKTINDDVVYFVPFIGISPNRYRDLFEKGKRKDSQGRVKEWSQGIAMPILNVTGTEYIITENDHLKVLIDEFGKKGLLLPQSTPQNP